MSIKYDQPAPTPESDEQFVRDVLDNAMSETRAPHHLPITALAMGRRQRARRRLSVTAATVAASVLVVSTAPALVRNATGTGDAPGGTQVASDGGQTSQAPSQDPAPSSTPTPATDFKIADSPPGWWDMTVQQMEQIGVASLPEGVVVDESRSLNDDVSPADRSAFYTALRADADADGQPSTGQFDIRLAHKMNPVFLVGPPKRDGTGDRYTYVDDLTCAVLLAAASAGEDVVSCEEILDSGGEVIGRRSKEIYGPAGSVHLEVDLRRDGGVVTGTVSNTSASPDGIAISPEAPLTLDQLEAIVRDDAWTSYRP